MFILDEGRELKIDDEKEILFYIGLNLARVVSRIYAQDMMALLPVTLESWILFLGKSRELMSICAVKINFVSVASLYCIEQSAF